MDTLTALRLGLLANQAKVALSRCQLWRRSTYLRRNRSNSRSVNSARPYRKPRFRLNVRNARKSLDRGLRKRVVIAAPVELQRAISGAQLVRIQRWKRDYDGPEYH